MKTAEIRGKALSELKEMLLSLKEEQFNLKMQKSMGQLENTSRTTAVKRDIARVKTLITEKSNNG